MDSNVSNTSRIDTQRQNAGSQVSKKSKGAGRRSSSHQQRRGSQVDSQNRREPRFDSDVVLRESRLLEEMLVERGCLPVGWEEDEQRRQVALETLETILCQWASSMQEKSEASKWKRPRVTLITFGSYRLRVHRPESDLDVLAMAPPACSRGDFFTSLVSSLQSDERIQNVHAIPSAYTPVIKCRLNEVPIDMLFCRATNTSKILEFQQKSPPPVVTSGVKGNETSNSAAGRREYLIDDTDLIGADDAGVRSLNGVRVTQLILDMVEPNIEAFRVTLCAVKEWAIIHGVYSNILGFLGGINFAILVAWVCKKHPESNPSTLLRIFFRTFAMWRWPNPVQLCPIQKDPPEGINVTMPIWDPNENPRDAKHLMPILTPAYPCMNSAYNVGVPQLRRLQEEMIRAARTLERGEKHWRKIFDDSDFFYRHSNYLQVTISAKDANDFLTWRRFCESRMRLLITSLETHQVTSWPFAKFFAQQYPQYAEDDSKKKKRKGKPPAMKKDGTWKRESSFFIALRFAPGVENVDLRYYIGDFLQKMNAWEERKDGMDLGICHLLQEDLPWFVFSPDEEELSTRKAEVKDVPRGLNEEGRTRLTPEMQRSMLSEDEIEQLKSPQKKAKSQKEAAKALA